LKDLGDEEEVLDEMMVFVTEDARMRSIFNAF
jgi:hypothetical protein